VLLVLKRSQSNGLYAFDTVYRRNLYDCSNYDHLDNGKRLMKNEKQAKSVIRKIIRKAKRDWTTGIYVDCAEENVTLSNCSQLERDLIDAIFSVDASIIRFVSLTTGRRLGEMLIVLEHDSLPSEIICDYTCNDYMERLINA